MNVPAIQANSAAPQAAQQGAAQATSPQQVLLQGITVRGGADGARTVTVPDGKGGEMRINVGKDGITINGEKISLAGNEATSLQPPMPSTPPDVSSKSGVTWDIPDNVVAVFAIASAIFLIVKLTSPLVRTFAAWMDRKVSGKQPVPDVTERLKAIEQAVELVAVEVERISEGQRFTTRILTDRAAHGAPAMVPVNAPTFTPSIGRAE